MSRVCACPCGGLLPDGKRKDARYIDAAHRARAAEARKAADALNPPRNDEQAHRGAQGRSGRAVPDRVVTSMAPIDAMAAVGALRVLACALPDPLPLAPAIDSLERSIERRRRRLTNRPKETQWKTP